MHASDAVRLAQAGDQDAFHALYREHVGRVFAVCLRLTGDRGAAEERTQDVFVQAWRRLSTFRGDSAFGSWLYRLTINVVLNERRAFRRRIARVEAVEDPGAWERPRGEAGPGAAMDLEAAIARLPEGARAVFVLHDVDGYRHEEIGTMLGIAVGTSKAQLFRARRLLREMLER
ncbi:MAG TPA: RNA polymerase sigma factor [Gemmatimonadales bacterium]